MHRVQSCQHSAKVSCKQCSERYLAILKIKKMAEGSALAWPESATAEDKKHLLKEAGKNGGWRKLKQDIATYNAMREQVIEEMENQKDPLYQRYLKLYKECLSDDEFDKNRLRIYAICNQRAMQECLSVDEMVNVVSYGYPQPQYQPPPPSSEPENLATTRREPANPE